MKEKLFSYGYHAVRSILEHDPTCVEKLYLAGKHRARLKPLLDLAESHAISVEWMDRKQLDSRFPSHIHQGIVAWMCRPVRARQTIDEYGVGQAALEVLLGSVRQPWLFLILDGVTSPHNLGACLRSANAFGVHAVIAPKNHAVGLTPAVYKVACGAADRTPFVQVSNLARVMRELKTHGVWLYGAVPEAQRCIYDLTYSPHLSVGFVLGSESHGLRHKTRLLCDDCVRIPMAKGAVSSLNVSVATGICLAEVCRQRSHG